jgi:GntR family transcriptional regulator, transcriptional repressor for pyruvate dehydrogenase complex
MTDHDGTPEARRPGDTTFLAPVDIRNMAEVIADRLVTTIALGEVVPGHHLPSARDLADRLRVSRSTVREAIQRLSAAAFVEVRRGRFGGAYVRSSWLPTSSEMLRRAVEPDRERLGHVLDFRDQIEPPEARLAAERRTDEHIEAMRRALAAYDAAADREASRAADEALHTAVAAAAGNPHFLSLRRRLHAEVSFGGHCAEPFSAEIRPRAVDHHHRLVEAIVARDPDRAAAVASEHFALTRDMVAALFERTRNDVNPPGPPA